MESFEEHVRPLSEAEQKLLKRKNRLQHHVSPTSRNRRCDAPLPGKHSCRNDIRIRHDLEHNRPRDSRNLREPAGL